MDKKILTITKESDLSEVRCRKCGALLFKCNYTPTLEIKCRKCKYINKIN